MNNTHRNKSFFYFPLLAVFFRKEERSTSLLILPVLFVLVAGTTHAGVGLLALLETGRRGG